MDKENLEFAALLHDIGKFSQRGEFDYDAKFSNSDYGSNGAHAKWSADCIMKKFNDDIVDLALYHHNPNGSNYPELCAMLQKADHHSSAERICADKQKVKETPLISIFSEVKIENNNVPDEYYVPLKALNLDDDFESIKPKVNSKGAMDGYNLVPNYKKLWSKFIKEFSDLSKSDYNTVLALLRKYTSSIPSAAYVSKPDISLFDHSKTTSALAVCRYLYARDGEEKLHKTTDDQEVYLAINGDISGIQSFIFKISSPQEAQSGMSKRLRGRSLYLTLLTDAIASYITKELELTQANILFCGGGRFTIIGPNTEIAKSKLAKIKEMINEEFINQFNAELYLSLVYEECAGSESKGDGSHLAEFGKVTKILNNKLVEDKKHKFVNNLDKVFSFEDNIKYDDICSVCGNLYKKKSDDEFLCDECKSHEDLGRDVANANYMIKCYLNDSYDFSNAKKDFSFYNKNFKLAYFFMNLDKSSSKLQNKLDKLDMYLDNVEIIKLNDTNFLEFSNDFDELTREKLSFSFSYLGNTVPRYSNNTPLYFEHLAQISKGSNKLGILKMDVDNLGLIFSTGFNHLKKNDGGMSISRVSTLSSQLDYFFSGLVNKIASKFKVYKKVPNLEDKFDSIELTLQDEEESKFIVYKKKYSVELTEDEEKSLEKYEIPTIHINYSGGDDLLVLGPYDDVIFFAQELRNRFKEWTANNNSINLSAGISIVSPKFPIGKAVDMAEEFLEASKSCGKDKITVFGEVVDWHDDGKSIDKKGLNTLFKFAEKLEKYNYNGKVSSGVIYSMLHMWQNSFKQSKELPDSSDEWTELTHNKVSTKRFVPLFKYKLRLIKDRNVRDDLDKNGIKLMPWIKIPVSWVSLRMR